MEAKWYIHILNIVISLTLVYLILPWIGIIFPMDMIVLIVMLTPVATGIITITIWLAGSANRTVGIAVVITYKKNIYQSKILEFRYCMALKMLLAWSLVQFLWGKIVFEENKIWTPQTILFFWTNQQNTYSKSDTTRKNGAQLLTSNSKNLASNKQLGTFFLLTSSPSTLHWAATWVFQAWGF